MSYVNPRLQYLCHARPACPRCNDTRQQQILSTWVSPAQWQCRMCKRNYRWEPEGTPTLQDAEDAIAATRATR